MGNGGTYGINLADVTAVEPWPDTQGEECCILRTYTDFEIVQGTVEEMVNLVNANGEEE